MKRLAKIGAFQILVLLSYGSVVSCAQDRRVFDPATLSDAGKTAYQTVLNAAIFSIGGVGIAGETSKDEYAMVALLSEPNGVAALRSLVTDATPEGGLYGLAGLYVKDLQTFNTESAVFLKRDFPANRKNTFLPKIPEGFVLTQEGCLIGAQKPKTLVERIATGKYDWGLKRYSERK